MKGKGATRKPKKQALFASIDDARFLKPLSIGITVISILVAVVLLLLQAVNKHVDVLVVNDDLEHITLQMITEEITPWFPDGYVYMDISAIKDKLQSMVMIANVSVEKVWPNQLKIKIEEERPVAIWNGKSMLSEKGDILPLALKQLALPQLDGVNSESKMVMQHFLLFNRWGKRHQLSLTGIQHSSAGWKLEYETGMYIWLDNNTAMNGLQQLDSVIEQFDLTRIKQIDMRYEQGFAVAWKASNVQVQG